jgi:5'-nucleotidase
METRRAFIRRSILLYLVAACACAPIGAKAPAPSNPAPSSPAPSSPPQAAPRSYRILITNDDGVRAPGILAVAQALQSLGDITIAAPAENQSGKSHSIITSDPIFVDQVTLAGGLRGYSIVATPATCVKVGVRALTTNKPDLVVSGINRGYNLGRVTYVSGTVGAAREAALMGIPAIASSLSVDETNYAAAAEIVRRVAEMVHQRGLDAGVLLNVNVPPGASTAIRRARHEAERADRRGTVRGTAVANRAPDVLEHLEGADRRRRRDGRLGDRARLRRGHPASGGRIRREDV